MYLYTNFLVDGLLLVLDLLLELSELCTVGCCAICLQNLNVPGDVLSYVYAMGSRVVQALSYSSVSGVIFFSSTSSSAKFFWYFSQLEPVAEGMMTV